MKSQPEVETANGSLGPCKSTIDPSLQSGSFSGVSGGIGSCQYVSLIGEINITWNTGRRTSFTFQQIDTLITGTVTSSNEPAIRPGDQVELGYTPTRINGNCVTGVSSVNITGAATFLAGRMTLPTR